MGTNPFATPRADVAVPTPSLGGDRLGLWSLGVTGTLLGLVMAAAVLVGSKPEERMTAQNLALVAFVFGGLLVLPSWGIGLLLGRNLERSGFWRGLGWCLGLAGAWGTGAMAAILAAAALVNTYNQNWDGVRKVFALDQDTLVVLGVFLGGAAGPTLIAGAITGGVLRRRRRRS